MEGNRKSGEVFTTPITYRNGRLCRGCLKPILHGEKVVLVTGTRRSTNTKYSNMRHIECFVDAKGNRMVKG